MSLAARFFRNRDGLAVLFLAIWPWIYFLPIALGLGLWLGADTLRTYFPLGVELSRSLSQGRLPLWTNGISAGFPLLADGQIGALYPVNLLLYRFLPASLALPYDTLLHLSWAGIGMYALARSWKTSAAGALLAGLVFSFSGFFFTRLMHTTIILTGAWLPWLIFLQDRFQRAQSEKKSVAAIWFLLTVLSLAAQFLTGFPQIAFLNSLAFVVIGFCGRLLWNKSNSQGDQMPRRVAVREGLTSIVWTTLPVILGAGVAAIQLVPTAELAGYSVRGGAGNLTFVTGYSLPPVFLSQFVFPFVQGEPSEANNEYLAYFGLAPLVLAMLAPFLRRNRRTIFLALFALGALSLALGELNPIYQLLYRLPGLNLFRVPARYLYLFVFAAALLSATAFDDLASRLSPDPRAARSIAAFTLITKVTSVIAVVIALAYTQPLEFWMRAWQYLPWLLALAIGIVLWLARTRRIARGTWAVVLLGLVFVDLSSYAPAFLATIAPIVPASNIVSIPRSLPALDSAQLPGRFFTDESFFPSPPALRGSLFPNTSLIYDRESAQAYSSLALGRHEAYLIDPSPAMLNLANVRYFMVPLEPRPSDKSILPYRALAVDLFSSPIVISPTSAAAIEVTSFTDQAAEATNGTVAGEIEIQTRDGQVETFPLRLGIETADWDYARKHAEGAVQPNQAPVAYSFPAYWRSFARPFQGYTYLARFEIAPNGQTRDIIGIRARAVQPDVRLTIESVSLLDPTGRATALATLAQRDNFAVAFLSDTVVAWKNLDVLPRAFIVHSAQVVNDDTAFDLLKKQQLRADREVLLEEGTALQEPPGASAAHDAVEITNYQPEKVALTVTTDRAGYLFLGDTWYPGWNALIDGKPAPIYRADFLFRAVPLEPGQHTVIFEYQPMSFRLGVLVSAASLLLVIGISIILHRRFASNS